MGGWADGGLGGWGGVLPRISWRRAMRSGPSKNSSATGCQDHHDLRPCPQPWRSRCSKSRRYPAFLGSARKADAVRDDGPGRCSSWEYLPLCHILGVLQGFPWSTSGADFPHGTGEPASRGGDLPCCLYGHASDASGLTGLSMVPDTALRGALPGQTTVPVAQPPNAGTRACNSPKSGGLPVVSPKWSWVSICQSCAASVPQQQGIAEKCS